MALSLFMLQMKRNETLRELAETEDEEALRRAREDKKLQNSNAQLR